MNFYRNLIQAPYEGGKFRNLENQPHGFGDVLKWLLNRKRAAWPEWIDSEQGTKPADRLMGLRMTFVNHSTVLVQVEGINILTDPVWSGRAGPVSFIGAKRVRAPGLRFDDLPVIDIVLLSHNHYDHMDMPTLKALDKRFSPLFVTGLGNREFLEKHGLKRVEEFDWWERIVLPRGNSAFFVPAQHFSGRTPWNIDRTLWGGFIIESPIGKIYFAGDTGFGEFFEKIHERFSDIRLALIPIGAYEPRWFMAPMHLSPDDAVRVHKILRPDLSVGIHFGTFHLSDEGIEDPAIQLGFSLLKHNVKPEDFIVPGFGETINL